MSNYLAVATVTETLRFTLASAISPVVGAATVTTGRPPPSNAADGAPRVNLFLYQATPNAYFRNADVPTRNSDGQLVQRPRAALDLHYLLTFYGEDATQDDQQLLGLVVRTLHTEPTVTRDRIDAAVAAASNHWLDASDLAQEIELVRFTPVSLSLEDLSKLWSIFPQSQYELSLAYIGSVVFIEPLDEPISVLPVLDRNVYAVTMRSPAITKVAPAEGSGWPIVPGGVLKISGRNFSAPHPGDTRLLIDGKDVAANPGDADRIKLRVDDREIELQLAASLPAPVQGLPLKVGAGLVRVQQRIAMGSPAVPHLGLQSNTVTFLFQPRVAVAGFQPDPAPARSGNFTLSIDPPLSAGQRASLILASVADGRTTVFPITPPVTPGQPPPPLPVNPITIAMTPPGPGAYYVQVVVDGVESPLTRDTTAASPTAGRFIPQVTVP